MFNGKTKYRESYHSFNSKSHTCILSYPAFNFRTARAFPGAFYDKTATDYINVKRHAGLVSAVQTKQILTVVFDARSRYKHTNDIIF